MERIDREGIFRVKPIEFGVVEGENGSMSVGIAIKFKILEQLAETAKGAEPHWIDWHGYDVEADGVFYIIKKDGSIHEDGMRRLIVALGWDGDLDKLLAPWDAPACQITVKNDPYNGQDRFKAAWINPYDYQPSGMFAVKPESVSRIKSQYGSKLRAVAGNVARNMPARPVAAPAAPATSYSKEFPMPIKNDAKSDPREDLPF